LNTRPMMAAVRGAVFSITLPCADAARPIQEGPEL
jgi:hypothetical protein